MTAPWRCYAGIFVLTLIVGCGVEKMAVDSKMRSRSESSMPSLALADKEGQKSDDDASDSLPDNRKIIYSAELSVVVENFDPVESALADMVTKMGGYIANSDVDTKDKKRRRGSWTVRIPVAKFDRFLNEAGSLGVPVSRSRNARDVTEEYVDVEARIANKRKLEARILELLERPDDKIQHVIEVERELGRVREEIERMEGRIRYLKDKIDLTTVNVSIWEEKEYRPPAAPGFGSRITSAWQRSLLRLRRGFENFVVNAVENAFAILFFAVIGIPALLWVRRKIRSFRTSDSASD